MASDKLASIFLIHPKTCANFVLVLNVLLDSSNQKQSQCAENTPWHKSNLSRN